MLGRLEEGLFEVPPYSKNVNVLSFSIQIGPWVFLLRILVLNWLIADICHWFDAVAYVF